MGALSAQDPFPLISKKGKKFNKRGVGFQKYENHSVHRK